MTTSVTIKLPVEIENLIDSIFGAGATYTYWWYTHVVEHPAEQGSMYSVGILTDEDDGATTYALLDVDSLVETIERIVSERLYGWQDVLHGALHDDFDANSADTVLQTAVLGKVVWA